MKSKVRIDANNEMWIDISGATLHDVQRACLMGGELIVFHLYKEHYRLGWYYNQGKLHIQFYGIEITKDQFETQMSMWQGDHIKKITPGTELLLLDNLYFL